MSRSKRPSPRTFWNRTWVAQCIDAFNPPAKVRLARVGGIVCGGTVPPINVYSVLIGPRSQRIFPCQQFPRTPQPSELTISSSNRMRANERPDEKYDRNSFRITCDPRGILRASSEHVTPMILWAARVSRRLRLASRVHDFGLQSKNAGLRQRTDCSSPQVGRGATRGRTGRSWLGVGACRGQGLGLHSQPTDAVD